MKAQWVAFAISMPFALCAEPHLCNLCVSFLDTTERQELVDLRTAIEGDCNECNAMNSDDLKKSCSQLCDHVGVQTFTSLIDVSDYVGSKDMCAYHQVCEHEAVQEWVKKVPEAVALLEVESKAMTTQANATKKPGNVTINGDLTVTGSLKTKSIRSSALTVNGSITVTHGVRTEFLDAKSVKSWIVETGTLSSPTGQVQLSGTLNMNAVGAAGAGLSTSFLETGTLQTQNLIQNGVKQWQLVSHDDFESEGHGWESAGSFLEVSNANGNTFMGGHCKMAGGEVTKRYDDLPEHSHLRLSARYHYIDSWEGETSFLKIDDKYAWIDSVDSRHSKGLNMHGSEHPEAKWGAPVDVIVPHTSPSAFITFGSTLDEHPCDESFGVDDVMVSVR